MTLRDIIAQHPALFYPQEWYVDEAFMDEPLPDEFPNRLPGGMSYIGMPPEVIHLQLEDSTVPASVLAFLYVMYPDDPIWRYYLWTSDLDQQGQRVYVGSNGKGLEIHRHLHITDRWAVPTW